MRQIKRDPQGTRLSRTQGPAVSQYSGAPRGLGGQLLRYGLMRAKVRLAYRADFLVNAVGDVLVAGIGVVFLWAIFRNVPTISGWAYGEVLFVWGMAEATTGLFYVCFQGLWSVNQRYVLLGEMDRVLLRPLDPYVQIMLDNVNLEALPVALLGVLMMAYASTALPAFALWRWLLLPVFLFGGVAVLAGVLTAVSSVGFRVLHRGTAVGLVYQAAAFNRYPVTIFPRWIQRVLTFVVPFAFTAFFPATFFLGRNEWLGWALVQPLVGLLVLVVGVGIWRRGLRHYRSPGS
jgi:ABC-2 type transport system permease protein